MSAFFCVKTSPTKEEEEGAPQVNGEEDEEKEAVTSAPVKEEEAESDPEVIEVGFLRGGRWSPMVGVLFLQFAQDLGY